MKPSWKPSAKHARDITMFPELAHYEAQGLAVTIHQADKFYAIVRGENTEAAHVSETREGIFAMLEAFKSKYPT